MFDCIKPKYQEQAKLCHIGSDTWVVHLATNQICQIVHFLLKQNKLVRKIYNNIMNSSIIQNGYYIQEF